MMGKVPIIKYKLGEFVLCLLHTLPQVTSKVEALLIIYVVSYYNFKSHTDATIF